MSRRLLPALTIGILVSGGMAIAAQQAADTQKSDAGAITVSGCIQNENSVLKKNPISAHVGMTDEFVIINATLKKDQAPATEPKSEAEPPAQAPVGTSGTASNFGKVYRLTGPQEQELKTYIGQRVEIAGTFKNDSDAKAELGAVGTSGRTVTGELTTENTPEITVISIKPASGTCSPIGK
jgi:hypothetical protein